MLCLSDPHLTDNPRDQYRHDFMDGLLSIMEKRKPDAIAILGDLTEEKDRHSAKLVNKVVGELGAIADIVPLLILMGNHDYKNEGHPFFAFTQHIPNIAWVDRVSIAADLPRQFRSIFAGCLFLPHTLEYERDWADLISAKRLRDFRFIFAHNTFEGSLSNGRPLSGIPIGILDKKSKVISGDVHNPQQVGPVTYIGAPYTVDFGDDYDPRLIMIDGYNMQSISVKRWPQKRLLTIDDVAELEKIEDELNPGDILKVRCAVDDMGTWHSTHRAIQQWANDAGVILFRAEPIVEAKGVRRNVRVRAHDDAVTDTTLMKQFAKRHDVDDATFKVGMEFVK